jgi:very-short-patch-repair endonuclease
MKKCEWSLDDVDFLLSNLNTLPLKVISEKLNKKYYSVLYKKKELINSSENYVKDGWNVCKTFSKSLGYYDINETKDLLLNNNFYKNYFGKSGNRRLIKDNPKLYNSVMYHSNILNDIKDKNSKSFTARIIFILNHNCDINTVKCECGLNICFKQKFSPYKDYQYRFQPFCVKCQPKYPSDRYFKFKYGDEWAVHKEKHINKMKSHKVLSKEWFIKKHGTEGVNKYMDFYTEKINTLFNTNKNLNNKKYSKISQKLFDDIKNSLPKDLKIYYAENNGEYFINLNDEQKINMNKFCIRPDFLIDNKIIEFNGDYWHKYTKDSDNNRYEFLKSLGYDILVIQECDYKKTPHNVLEKCLQFING